MAQFIVFQPNGRGFVEVGRTDASNSDQAIEKLASEPGKYVAVAEARFEVVEVAPIEALRVVKEPTSA